MATSMPCDSEKRCQTLMDNEIKQNQTSSKHLLYSEKYSENHIAERLKICNKKQKQHFSVPAPQTFKVPKSSVLNKVKEFLPQMEEANDKLAEFAKSVPSCELDIENIAEYSGPIIEMNLAIMETEDSSSDEYSSDCLSDCDSNSDCVESENSCVTDTDMKLKLTTKNSKNKANIVELSQSDPNSDDKNIER